LPSRLSNLQKETLFLKIWSSYNSVWEARYRKSVETAAVDAAATILKLMADNPGLEETAGSCRYDEWWEQHNKGKRGKEPWEKLSLKKEGKLFRGWMYTLVWELAVGGWDKGGHLSNESGGHAIAHSGS
jgi:hypothetical protein